MEDTNAWGPPRRDRSAQQKSIRQLAFERPGGLSWKRQQVAQLMGQVMGTNNRTRQKVSWCF